MIRFVVVKVSYDYHRFENYLGIYSSQGLNGLEKLVKLSVKDSKYLGSELTASEVLGEDMVHYMVEEITND